VKPARLVTNSYVGPARPAPYADPARAARSADSSAQVLAFHRGMPGYRPTPLVSAPAIAARLGVAQAWVKDESSRLGMPAFKILGASWATYRLLCERAGAYYRAVDGLAGLRALVHGMPLTLVAATDGNHGRAVARMARELGLGAHVLVPRDMVAARIQALRDEGARVTVVPGTYDDAVAASARLADDTRLVVSDTSWPGYERVPAWVIEGYATIAAEVRAQLAHVGAEPPTVVAAQIGVGAFAAAVVRGFPGATVIGVEPARAACLAASIEAGELRQVGGDLGSIMAGLCCGKPSPIAWPALREGLHAVAVIEDDAAEEAMRVLAAAGVVSGESGAAGLAGLFACRTALALAPHDRVLVVCTEGATDPAAYRRIVRDANFSA
jgi:diaminopropionate ammonia-lyase